MLIYLDTCALQRPLDDQDQFNIQVESSIILAFLESVEAGTHEIVSSAVLRYEIENNPLITRRDFCRRVLSMAKINIDMSYSIEAEAARYLQSGIKSLDAAHLSSAIAAGADFLCTVDNHFLRKATAVNTLSTRVVSPDELKNVLSL